MAGRKPLPTKLKVLHGNPGKRKLNRNEPKPDPTPPKCPSHLDSIARKEWRRFSKVLERLGLLTEVDGSAFAAYCDQYSLWVQINRDLKAQEDELRIVRAALREKADAGDADSQEKLLRMPASALVVHDYNIDPMGQEHLKISPNPLVTMRRQTLQQIRAFTTEFGMTPSSRGRIQVEPQKKETDEEAFLKEAGK